MGGVEIDGPFYEGQNAFDRGESRAACPADVPPVIRAAWLEGWREAKRYADVRAIIEAARSPQPFSATLFARIAGDEPGQSRVIAAMRRRPERRPNRWASVRGLPETDIGGPASP